MSFTPLSLAPVSYLLDHDLTLHHTLQNQQILVSPRHVTFLVLKAQTWLWNKREALRYRLRLYIYLSDGGKKVGRYVSKSSILQDEFISVLNLNCLNSFFNPHFITKNQILSVLYSKKILNSVKKCPQGML